MHRPTSVTVFGILNLIFGGLGMCGLVFLAILMFVPIEGFDPNSGMGPLEEHPVFQAYQQISVGLGFVSSIVLIAAGIGLLRLRPWGRTLSIVYAGYAIVSTILGTIINFAVMMPIMMQQAEAAEGPARAAAMGGAIGGSVGGCVGLIYPVLLLYFMLRPHVRAAFLPFPFDDQPSGRPFEETGNPYQSP
jgi:hypothetical protein